MPDAAFGGWLMPVIPPSGVTGVFDQVRELSHGIHPAVLSERD